MNRSTPGLPVHHRLPEFTQTQVHRVSDAIQPSHPMSSPSPPAPNPSSIRVFSNESTLRMRWPYTQVNKCTEGSSSAQSNELPHMPPWEGSMWEPTEMSVSMTLVMARASLVAQMVKNPPTMRETWVWFLGREGGGGGNPPQYSCLENPMDRGAWRATAHGVPKSWTRLSN